MQTGDEIVRVAFKRIYVSFRWSRCSRGFSVAENWRMMAVEGTDGNEMMEIQGVAVCRVGCTNSVFCNLSIKIFVWKHIRANDEFVFFFCSYKAFRAFFFTFFLFFYCSRFVSFFFWKYWIYFQLLYWITSIILVFFFKISRDYFSLFNIALLYRSKFYKNGYFEFLLNLQR